MIDRLPLPNKRRIKGVDAGELLFREIKAGSGLGESRAVCFVCRISPINLFMKNTFCIEWAAVTDKGCGKKAGTMFFDEIGTM